MLRSWTPWLPLLAAPLIVIACLPHPGGDYDDFIEKTADMRNTPPDTEDGGGIVVDSGPPPTEATRGTYFVACLPNLGFGDITKTLRFVGSTEFTPTDDTGTLSLKLAPLPVTATTFDTSNTVGTPLDVGDAIPVAADGAFSGSIANATIEGSANPISGGNITLENVTLNGKFSGSGPFCSGFSGKVTAPIRNDFEAKCVYLPVEDGTEFTVTATELSINEFTFGANDFGCQ